ncbi:MAG TPA: aminotransferase class IV [Magnetospirillum sp.]|nr:aminotransferase class IV [Magnetospirillum sp.]
MLCYWNGQYVPREAVSISPDDRGFLFADGLYDVVRAYDGHLFRLADHLERLARGARALAFRRTDFAELAEVASTLLLRNDLLNGDATFYVQVTRGAAPRSHAFPSAETPLTVYATVKPFTPLPAKAENGVAVISVPDMRWRLCSIKTTALTWNVMANQRAKEAGVEEAMFFRDGKLTEGSHTNVLIVRDGAVVSPVADESILDGITRRAVLELCRAEGIAVVERDVSQEEVAEQADEVMLVGTTTEVMPVIALDGRPVGGGAPGPVTRRLQQLFRGEVARASQEG